MTPWPSITIDEVCIRIIDYRGKTPRKSSSGVRLVTAKVVKAGRINEEPAEFIAEDYFDEWMRRGLPEQFDTVITTEAPLGEVGLIRASGRIALGQRIILLRPDPAKMDKRFLHQVLQTALVQGRLAARATGTTVLGIKQSQLRKVELPYPPLETQRRIAAILGAYDDLIEVNRRRVAVLEEMARSLFDEWFVRFRFPGHESVPMIDTPDGPLPQGWSWRKLSEVADLCLGKMLDNKKNKGNLRPYLANINVRWGSLDLQDLREMRFEDRELERYGLRRGDIVMCEGGEPGRCVLWRDQMPGMMIQKALHRIRPAEGVESEYLYYALFHRGRSGGLEQYFTGATIKHLPGEQLAKVNVAVPGASTQSWYSNVVRPMLQLTDTLIAQCADLAASRDLLLPRLISGQLSVQRAEKELEMAA
jgi:type I restriction enzyme S subunit